MQNNCDTECRALGLLGILPGIFHDEPNQDLVSLHYMLFTLQYSSAKCWLDCGLEVDTLIGHSLGQLTALCIPDSISLKDALRLISGRTHLMRDCWGKEPGVMLSVECDGEDIAPLLKLVNSKNGFRVDLACHNGPRSFVLAGDTSSIEKVEENCRSPGSATRFKTVRLKNTHAYHLYLADDIMPGLERIVKAIEFRKPRLHVETCSSDGTWLKFTAGEVIKHTREPVYFSDTVDRTSARLPSAVWLEIGSASPIITMTRRILASRPDNGDVFIPIDIGSSNATTSLVNATYQF